MTKMLLERREIEELTGLSCASIYRKMRSGTFPEPIKISDRAVRWKLAEIEAWIESRPRATGATAAA